MRYAGWCRLVGGARALVRRGQPPQNSSTSSSHSHSLGRNLHNLSKRGAAPPAPSRRPHSLGVLPALLGAVSVDSRRLFLTVTVAGSCSSVSSSSDPSAHCEKATVLSASMLIT